MDDNSQTAVAAVTSVPAMVAGFRRPAVSGVPAVFATGAYARADWDRTVEITIGDLAGTTADKAGRRISALTHNSTFRGRPRRRPV